MRNKTLMHKDPNNHAPNNSFKLTVDAESSIWKRHTCHPTSSKKQLKISRPVDLRLRLAHFPSFSDFYNARRSSLTFIFLSEWIPVGLCSFIPTLVKLLKFFTTLVRGILFCNLQLIQLAMYVSLTRFKCTGKQ